MQSLPNVASLHVTHTNCLLKYFILDRFGLLQIIESARFSHHIDTIVCYSLIDYIGVEPFYFHKPKFFF